MQSYICTTCGVAHAPSDAPPPHCVICEDERQYVNPNGQAWTTQADLRKTHKNDLREQEPGLTGICTAPGVAIGQRALWIAAPEGGVLWDNTPLCSDEAVAAIKAKGGLRAIAISHPHFYSAMTEWSRKLGDVPIYLHADDRDHVMDPSPNIQFWTGETKDLGGGVTLICCGGHFTGSTALHWAAGAGGKGALFTADTVMVNPDPRWMSFMRSYPNALPVNAATVRRITGKLEPYAFDRMYGGWWDRVCQTDAKARMHKSAERYIAAIS
jgi:glyoxylase-like metal-dependent hydrolase (beta-lactamase superfamily II)